MRVFLLDTCAAKSALAYVSSTVDESLVTACHAVQGISKFARSRSIDASEPPVQLTLDATPTTLRELIASCVVPETDYGYHDGEAMPYAAYLTATLLANKRMILWDAVLACKSSDLIVG
jgi:hypothetical protein